MALCLGAVAQSGSSDAAGYLRRAGAMMADSNYVGVLDQVGRALRMPLGEQERVEAECLRGCALVHTDAEQAIEALEQFLARHPGSVWRNRAAMALGDCYYGTDYQQALLCYDRVNPDALDPADRDNLLYRMACCLLKTQNYDSADMLYAKLLRSRTYGKAANFYRGYILYAKGEYADALKRFASCDATVTPGDMAPYYISQCCYMLQDYKRALATALTADKMTPADADADYHAEMLRIAGESAYQLGDYKQARKYLTEYAAATADMQPSAAYLLGLLIYGDNDFAQAERYLQIAADRDDAMGQAASLYVGQALMHQGDADGAILAFDRALKMEYDPEVTETACFNYAVAAQQGARLPFGNTVNAFERFLKLYPGSPYAPQAQEYVVAAYINGRNYQQALASIEAMGRPTDKTLRAKQQVLYMLGAQALNAGQYEQAVDYLSRGQKIKASDRDVAQETMLLLGEAQYGAGRPSQAVSELQSYVKSAGRNTANVPLAYYDLGYAQFALKKYPQAAAAFSKVLDNPGGLDAMVQADASSRLGDCYYYARDFESAGEAYDRAYDLNPKAGDYALLQKGLMEGYQRNHRQKIAMLDRLESEFPTSPLIPDALLEKTESYIQLGDNDQAIDVYRSLVKRYPGTSQGRQGALQMALTMLNAGHTEDAKAAYRDVITHYPSSEEAVQAADELKRLYALEGRTGEFMSFINSVPNAPRMDAGEADQLSFEAAEKEYITKDSVRLLELYVREYPQGMSRAKALAYLMEHAEKQADRELAYQYASALAQNYPDQAVSQDALKLMAQADEAAGDMSRALLWWRELADKASSPRMLNMARMGVARCGVATGENAEAVAATNALLRSGALDTEQRVEAECLQGIALSAQGHAREARDAWAQAAGHLSAPYGVQSAFLLAQSYYDAGDMADAEKWSKKVTEADTDRQYWVARAFILLSDIYAKQGNEFKAQQYLKSLRDNYPGDEQDIFDMIDSRTKKK